MRISVSELENISNKVDSLKESAKASTDFEDYAEALTELDNAIALLTPGLEALEAMKPKDAEQYKEWRLTFAGDLADCYGMKGGNYRRREELKKAEAMYAKGANFEVKYNIQDTYNRTNLLVLQLLRDPSRYEILGPMIKGALEIVDEQVNGKNKDKFWAWSDFGLLNILAGNLKGTVNREDYRREAHKGYKKFKEKGAAKTHFQTTINVLRQLKDSFAKHHEPCAVLLQEEIDYLNANVPAL